MIRLGAMPQPAHAFAAAACDDTGQTKLRKRQKAGEAGSAAGARKNDKCAAAIRELGRSFKSETQRRPDLSAASPDRAPSKHNR